MRTAVLLAVLIASGYITASMAEMPEPDTVCRAIVPEVRVGFFSEQNQPSEPTVMCDYYGTYEVETPYIAPKVKTRNEIEAHIFEECAEREIDPYIIMAMIHHESRWEIESIGDSGRAFGLMQIQPRWHEARIEELGVTDLLDPIQNVTVGIDFFDELMDMGKGLDWALMCYNGGPAFANRGKNINYAIKIKNTAEELRETR